MEIDGESGKPDSVFLDADVKRDHPPVFAPQPIENALYDGGLAAFPAGEQCAGLGRAFRNPADPFVQKREFLFPSHQKVGIARYGMDADFEKPVYDVMTGSLVTWPSPYRVVSILDNTFHIESRLIEEIDYDTQGMSFQDYGLNFLNDGLVSQASALLQSQFGVPAEQADAVAPLAAASLIAFYRGDETPDMQTLLTIGSLIADEETMVLGQLLGSLWTDLPPADNDLDLTIYDLDDASYPGLVYPHVAYSAAENTDTEISLVNCGPSEIQGKFIGYSEAGAAVYESDAVTLAANGRHGLTLSETGAVAETIAYMVFDTEAKTTDLKGCSRIKTNGQYARAIEATNRIGNGPIPLVHTASTSSWMTTIGLVNLSDTDKIAIIDFDNGETMLKAIPARGKVYRSVRSFFDGEAQPEIGSAVVRNGKDIVAMCDYQSLGDSTHYAGAMLMKTCLSPVLYFPDVQMNGDQATGIAIRNSLDAPVQATATPYDSSGEELAAVSIEIPANGKYVGVAQNLGFPEDTAWFKLAAAAGVAGMELTVSTDGKSMTGFSAPAAPGTQGANPTMEDDGSTIIGLVNTGDSIANVYLTAYDKDGLIIASGVSSLAGYASTTVTMDVFLPAGSSPELLDSMDYVRFTSTAPVIVYQINRSEDQMMADGLVNVDPCEITVTIAHMNDSHSHLEPESLSLSIDGVTTYCTAGGFPRIAEKIESLRKTQDHLLFLHAGDLFQGTLYFTEFKGMADLELVEMMGLDAMCVGNHEFDLGPSVLADFIDQADFPVLSANADVSNEPLLAGKVPAFTTVSFGEEKIGIIGLTTAETGIISSPGENVTFTDAATAAQNAADELTEAGVNKIVVLSHMGHEQDLQLAETVTDVDVIVGGHSHTLLGYMDNIGLSTEGDYPTIVDNPEDEEVLVVQAWNHGLALGLLEVTFDCDGKVVSHAGSPVIPLDDVFLQKDADGNKVEVDEDVKKAIESVLAATPAAEIVEEDEAAAAALAVYTAQIEDMKKEVIGQAAEDLYHVRIPGTEHATAGVLENGSLIAPVVARGMLEKAQAANLEPDMVLQNAGGVRVDILKGDITVAKVYELQPYGNTLVTVKLTGAQILEALEAGVEQALTGGSGAFPYTAGARFNVDLDKAEGERISQVQFKKEEDGWTDLDENATYVLVTNNFTASGGDGYAVLAEGEQYDTGYVDAEIFMEYVLNHTPISARKYSVNTP